MAQKRASKKKSARARTWGPKGGRDLTRAQRTAIVMQTYPDVRSGLAYSTIAERIGLLYADNAIKAHPVRGVQYRGREGVTNEYLLCMNAIPDMKLTTKQPKVFRDGDVEVAWELNGTHSGSFRGVKPSNKRVRITGVERFRFKGNEIIRHDVFTNYDKLGWNGIVVGAKPPKKPTFPKKETD